MAKEKLITYIPRKKTPFIFFTRERELPEYVQITKEAYDERRIRFLNRINSILAYAQDKIICRSQILLSYFGEKNTAPCGQCDVCLQQKTNEVREREFAEIKAAIINALTQQPKTINALVKTLKFGENKILQTIRFMLDNGELKENEMMRIEIRNK
jgi:ATP-dependent DNA helicase RecQ